MKKYIEDAMRTNKKVSSKALNSTEFSLLHAAMGLSTEAGEILDNLKKYLFYKKDIDVNNLKEELGDIFWYSALLCDTLKIDFEEIMDSNIKKLKVRYPDKFTNECALNRNLEDEIKAINNK